MEALHACVGHDPGRVCKILRLVRGALPAELARLTDAAGSCDVAVAHRSAHSIKSNAALVGAARLRAKAEQLESYGRTMDLDAVRRELGALRVLVEEVVAALGVQIRSAGGHADARIN